MRFLFAWALLGSLGAQTLAPETLARWLQERTQDKRHFLLVDVRTPGEHALGIIPGTDTLLPLAEIRQGTVQIPAAPSSDTVVLYCRTGRRAGVAQALLRQQGYMWVFNALGVRQWQQAGNPLVAPGPSPGSRRIFVTLRGAGALRALDPGDSWRAWPAGEGITYVAVSPDTVLVTSSVESKVYVFSSSGDLLKTLKVGKTPKGIKISPTGTLALVAEEGAGTVGFLDLQKGQRVAGIPVGRKPHNVVFAPDGRYAYVTVQGSNRIAEILIAERRITRTLTVKEGPHNLDLTPDEKFLLVANMRSNDVAVIDLHAWKVVKKIPVSPGHHGIDVVPTGDYALVTGIGADTLNLISLKTLERIRAVPVGKGPHGVRADPQGKRAYVALAFANELAVVALPSLRVIRRVPTEAVPFWIAIPGNP